MCVYANRSPPRTRRSSTSSTGSSNGNCGGGLSLTTGGLATAKRASRRRSRSPSPRVSAAGKLSAPVVDAVGRRSRSPTPRASSDRLAVQNAGTRSRSLTPRRKRRSASPSSACDRNQQLVVPSGGNRSRSPSVASRRCSGVDDTPTPKISLNFATATPDLVAELGDRSSRESSVDKQCGKTAADSNRDDHVTVDTSSTCRVSDNFRGTEQYHVLNPTPVAAIERRHSTVREEESEVDTTPFSRVSDSLRLATTHDGPPSATRKKSHSSHRDATRKSEPAGTDSGSEVSDEGYRSLGIVTTPPANANAKTMPKFNGKLEKSTRSKKIEITPLF